MKKLALKLIKLYQHTISPDHGHLKTRYPNGFCRFYPSCSEYSYKSIEKYGIIKGVARSIKRILRCNPLNQGGIDKP